MLRIQDLRVKYGAVEALNGISLAIARGEIVTLIGANGAGKTTLLRTISGLVRPSAGSMWFNPRSKVNAGAGLNLGTAPAHLIVANGLSHVPEGRLVFPDLTVLENLELGAFLRRKSEIGPDLERMFALFPRLKEREAQRAGTLSGGEQQMLAIGRALMSRPDVLLMDEPSLGLAPLLVRTIFDTIREINAAGTTILLVEQNARMALSVAHRGYVLETGKIVLEGRASDLAANED
ncbi:MAG TPA: ABC transporter ATP-binding protein, partial [bacterium]|nr:ABC transporter ATP-binding protein [bacterium]